MQRCRWRCSRRGRRATRRGCATRTAGARRSPKLDELEALVEEIVGQGTSKVLVFSEWVEMLKLAAARLDAIGVGWAMLHGGVPSERRPALLDRFRPQPRRSAYCCRSDAGGVGLNLQVANYVIHLDLPWNPARLDQRTSRAHRLGQTRGVSVTYLCAEDGIERGIEGTLAGKRAVRSAALDPTSDVEELTAPTFAMFVRELRDALEVAEPGEDIEVAGEAAEAAPLAPADVAPPTQLEADAQEAPPIAAPPELALPPIGEHEAPPSTSARAASEPLAAAPPSGREDGVATRCRAANRLRLARVVLDAGFTGDAVRAAYEALAAAITSLLDGGAPAGHTALVAAIYRDLVPAGRLPHATPAALARLHDLTALESAGVDVDADLARGAVAEAESWVERILHPTVA